MSDNPVNPDRPNTGATPPPPPPPRKATNEHAGTPENAGNPENFETQVIPAVPAEPSKPAQPATPPVPPPAPKRETSASTQAPVPPAPPVPPQAAHPETQAAGAGAIPTSPQLVPPQQVPQTPQTQQMPQGYPYGAEYQQPVMVAEEPKRSKLPWILSGIFAVILLVGAGLYAAWYFGYIGKEPEPVKVTVTKSKDADAKDDEDGATSSKAKKTTSAEPTPQALPSSAVFCSNIAGFKVYRGTNVTSCPFAENTADAARNLPEEGGKVDVFSPVTSQSYVMDCAPVGKDRIDCSGGNNALVILTK